MGGGVVVSTRVFMAFLSAFPVYSHMFGLRGFPCLCGFAPLCFYWPFVWRMRGSWIGFAYVETRELVREEQPS